LKVLLWNQTNKHFCFSNSPNPLHYGIHGFVILAGKQNPMAVEDTIGQNVGDNLRFSGTRRTGNDRNSWLKAMDTAGFCDAFRGLSVPGAARPELVSRESYFPGKEGGENHFAQCLAFSYPDYRVPP
jgi:hypothetical protein